MRDDDRPDDKYGAAAPPSRTDDAASSVPVDGESPTGARPAGRLTALVSRSRNGVDNLATTTRARLDELGATPVGSRTRQLFGRRDVRLTVATGVVCCLGFAAFTQTQTGTAGPAGKADPVAAQSELLRGAKADRAAGQAADRAERPVAAAPSTAPPATADPDVPAPAKTEAPTSAPPPAPVDPGPVAGLSEVQMDNAKAIVRTGRDMGLPRRALIIAVATAMQESNLFNLASGVLPESLDYPHQGVGWDHDSVGLFQQRSSSGWGPVDRLMDPAYATAQFLNALTQIPGWQQLPLTDAAQAVQVSSFGWLYAQHEGRATQVVDAIVPGRK